LDKAAFTAVQFDGFEKLQLIAATDFNHSAQTCGSIFPHRHSNNFMYAWRHNQFVQLWVLPCKRRTEYCHARLSL
jgi:hypothetical protein